MKFSLAGFTSLLTLGFLLNFGYSLYQRCQTFSRLGTPQTLTVNAAKGDAWNSILPPRKSHVYTGKIGNVDTLIETSHSLNPGQAYPIRYLRTGSPVTLSQLAGRADRLISTQAGVAPVWFAYTAGETTPSWRNLPADLPWPEAVFYGGWLLLLLVVGAGQLSQSGSRPLSPSIHPVLKPYRANDPAPEPASIRVSMPVKPPPLPGPTDKEAAPVADLPSLRRRPKTMTSEPPSKDAQDLPDNSANSDSHRPD